MATGDNNQVKSRRDAVMERLRGRNPEKEYADDEAVFGQISDDYDEYDKQITGYKEREGQFADMFNSDPRSAAFLMDWKNGKDPAVQFARRFGPELKDALDDPKRMDEIAAANKEFLEDLAEENRLKEEYKKNLAESLKTLEALQQEKGLSDDQVDEVMTMLLAVTKDAVLGKFSRATLDMAMNAINHDADVEAANHEGEVRGKNTRAKEELRKPKQGDGMAQLDGKNSAGTQRQRPKSIFDLANEAN